MKEMVLNFLLFTAKKFLTDTEYTLGENEGCDDPMIIRVSKRDKRFS